MVTQEEGTSSQATRLHHPQHPHQPPDPGKSWSDQVRIFLISLSLSPPGLRRPLWVVVAMVPSPRPLSPQPMLAPVNTQTAMWGVLRTSAPHPVGELLSLLAWDPASSHLTQTLRTVSPPPPSHRTPKARGEPPPAPPAPKRKTPNLHLHKSTPG